MSIRMLLVAVVLSTCLISAADLAAADTCSCNSGSGSNGSFDWATVSTTIPSGAWSCDGSGPSSVSDFVIGDACTVKIVGDIAQDPIDGIGITVESGGALNAKVTDSTGPINVNIGNDGFHCAGVCDLQGAYRQFGGLTPTLQDDLDYQALFTLGELRPCRVGDCSSDTHVMRFEYSPNDENDAALAAIEVGDVMCFYDPDKSDWVVSAEVNFCYEIIDRDAISDPRFLEVDVRQGSEDIGYLHARRDLSDSTLAMAVETGDRIIELPPDFLQSAEDEYYNGRWLRFEDDNGNPGPAYKIMRTTDCSADSDGTRDTSSRTGLAFKDVQRWCPIVEEGAAQGSHGSYTLQDTSKSWQINEFADADAWRIDEATGHVEKNRILSNTSDTLTLALSWINAVQNGDRYRIRGGGNDVIWLGDVRGVAEGHDLGEKVWVDYGWETGDPFAVIAPLRVLSTSASTSDANWNLYGNTTIDAALIERPGRFLPGSGSNTLITNSWIRDPDVPYNDAYFRIDENATTTLRQLSITGGTTLRQHGISAVSPTGGNLTFEDLALRHPGDDCFVMGPTDSSDVTLLRVRCGFMDPASESAEFLDAGGSGTVSLVDGVCDDCFNGIFGSAEDTSADGVLLWSPNGAMGNSAALTNVMSIGARACCADPNANASTHVFNAQLDHFVIRDGYVEGRWLRERATTVANGFMRNLGTANTIWSFLPQDGVWDNVAVVDAYTDRMSTIRPRVLYFLTGLSRISTSLVDVSILWAQSQDPFDHNMRYLIDEADSNNPGAITLDGVLMAHNSRPDSVGFELGSPLVDNLNWGNGPCIEDVSTPVLSGTYPPTLQIGGPLGFVDLSATRVDTTPASIADQVGCGIRGGVEAPGIKQFRWMHAVSGLAPELMADDPDEDGIPEDALAAACSGGAFEGCSDNCPTIFNPDQAAADDDGDGNLCDSDDDDDGLLDIHETNTGSFQSATDTGSDPILADTDGDGLSDGEEVNTYSTDPLNQDTDGDGLTDGDEVNVYTTDPINSDSDADGLTDGSEVNLHGTDPLDSDSDNDGLKDDKEVNVYLTDPLDPDSDGDGFGDGEEILAGSDPNDSGSTPPVTHESSLIIHTLANDQIVGTGFPFDQKIFIARPLGTRCNPGNGGVTCGSTTLQKGVPLTGSGTVSRNMQLTPPGFTLPLSALNATATGSLPQYSPYNYISTFAPNAHNENGFFGPGFGPGKRTVTFAGSGGPGARVAISPGANQFGGTMRILGTMGAKRAHSYTSEIYVGTGLSSFGVLGDECTITCYVTGVQSNFQSHQYQTAMGEATTLHFTSLGLPWTTGAVSITATVGPFPTLFRRTGYDNRTAKGLGTIQLVAPQLVRWDFPNRDAPWDRHTGAIGILRIKFVPEPSRWMMLSAGVCLLAGLYRLRHRT